jgi:hypothetical protein
LKLRFNKEQAKLVLTISKELEKADKRTPQEFLELCKLADKVSALNDSKKKIHNAQTVRTTFIEYNIIKE